MESTKAIYVRNWAALMGVSSICLVALGCLNTQPDYSPLARGPAPLRMPSPARHNDNGSFEDSLTGGEIFSMYCAQCHNPRPLSERPFANYRNVAAHMRVRANLTGKEYAKLMEFLRRWHDVPPPSPPPAPSPKRFIFSQPMAEQKGQTAPAQPPGNPGFPPQDVQNSPVPRPESSAILPAKANP
jgi:hypothetical protein